MPLSGSGWWRCSYKSSDCPACTSLSGALDARLTNGRPHNQRQPRQPSQQSSSRTRLSGVPSGWRVATVSFARKGRKSATSDTPGVYFVLCREIYPNLGCSVKISISRSHLSSFIKLLVKVSPISDFIRSPEMPNLEHVKNFYFSARMQTR
jgi:hypothetical protein